MWEFTIKQDGLKVSSGVGENKEDCIGEAFHYLCLYAEETFKNMTMEIKTNGGVKVKKGTTVADVYSSYLDEIELLQKKLDIAVKALKDISVSLWDETECRDCAKKALKEMEEV